MTSVKAILVRIQAKLKKAIHPSNSKAACFAIGQVIAIVFLACWWWPGRNLPLPGYAVGVVTVITAAMTIQGEMNRFQKAFWLLLIAAFVVTEFHAIAADREGTQAKANQDRATQDRAFENVLKSQDIAFRSTLSALDSEYRLSKNGFSDTARRANRLLDKTTLVASLSKESLESIQGTDSFPCILAESNRHDGKLSLIIRVLGKNYLSGVSARITPGKLFHSTGDERNDLPLYEIGTLSPGYWKPMPTVLTPNLESDGVETVVIEIFTQNGTYIERISIRRGVSWPWATKATIFHFPDGRPGLTPEAAAGCNHDWRE